MQTVFLALGSNLHQPLAQIQTAIETIAELACVSLQHCSSCYQSQPLGPQDQPMFVNAVVEVQTSLSAAALLDQLLRIEQQMGRVRGQHWGPRIIDIDIILYGDAVINTPHLTVPHAGLTSREFVLVPLAELAADWVVPTGETVAQLLAALPPYTCEKIKE